MVFDPTFHEIEHEAAGLPDLAGDDVAIGAADLTGDAGPAELDEDEDAVAEGGAEAEIVAADAPENALPPYGED